MNDRFEGRSRFGNNDRQQFTPPVRVDEELDVKIEAVGEKGDGVAKKNGFVLFVPGVKEGDYVRVKITRVLKKVGFAEVVGEAQTPEPQARPVEERQEYAPRAEPEEEFKPSEDDSEDFGEESSDDEESQDSNQELDDESDEDKK